ncbi:MAG: hypothetical protein HRF43_06270 [Phycisphaerae bacterium]|jgi:hypothetical protein
MGLFFALILLAACLWLGVGLAQPVFFIGFVLVLLWLVVAVLAKFMCWMLGLTSSRSRRFRPGADEPIGRVRVCPDPYCGRSNVPAARFCAQCGRRLA